jgi:hypothetical protein
MISKMMGNQPTPTKQTGQLHDKMLVLAQNLLLEEMYDGSLFACGDSFTTKMAGKYGQYETFNGEVIAFRPKASLKFALTCGEWVIAGDLATIQVVTRRLDDYELGAMAE